MSRAQNQLGQLVPHPQSRPWRRWSVPGPGQGRHYLPWSRKHYIEVAKVIADEVESINVDVEPTRAMSCENIARALADVFKAENSRFDRQRFRYFACALSANGRVEHQGV